MVKAIETEYNGYKFRSRLEARWAVFFDTLGVEYEYEKEGYDLDGVRYLPDFWLPRLDLWAEIKGERLKSGSDDEEKVKRLVKYSRKPVAVFSGDINIANLPDIYMIVESLPDWDTMKIREALVVERNSSWTECPICHTVGLARHAFPSLLPCRCYKDADKSPSIVAAYAEARKARFEFEDAKPKQKIKISPREEFIQQLQVEAKKPSSSPDWPDWDDMPFPPFPEELDKTNDVTQPVSALTIDEVKQQWDYVKRRVKSKKDGAKIASLLNGYDVVGVEDTQKLPVIVLQSKADFFYDALHKRVDYFASIEWSFKVELKCECKFRLVKGPTYRIIRGPVLADD